MNKYTVMKKIILLISVLCLMFAEVSAQNTEVGGKAQGIAYEGYTLEIIKPLSDNNSGQIRIHPIGRSNCVNCYADVEYTQNTIIYINGAKQKYSPFDLTQLKFKFTDVLAHENGVAGSINVYD